MKSSHSAFTFFIPLQYPSFNCFFSKFVGHKFLFFTDPHSPSLCLCFWRQNNQNFMTLPRMSQFRWWCNVFCFDLKSFSFQTRHQTSILVKMREVIVCLQKSSVCKNKWDFALTENGSAAQNCNKDLTELRKTTEVHGQANRQVLF